MEQINISDLVRSYFNAYETNERAAMEKLLCEDFTFTSPVDDHINKDTYFEHCWPSCINIQHYHIQNLFIDGNEAFIRYTCELQSGKTFRNMEHFQFVDGEIKAIVVYFGFGLGVDSSTRVKKLNDAFATGDTEYVIENVAEDVQWHLVGGPELRGKEAAKNMLQSMRGIVPKKYKTKNIIINGNKAVVEGTMKMPKSKNKEQLYAFCDIYTFDHANQETINQLSAYLIELPNREETDNE